MTDTKQLVQQALDRGDNVVLITRASEIPRSPAADWLNPAPATGPFPNRVNWRKRWETGTGNLPKSGIRPKRHD